MFEWPQWLVFFALALIVLILVVLIVRGVYEKRMQHCSALMLRLFKGDETVLLELEKNAGFQGVANMYTQAIEKQRKITGQLQEQQSRLKLVMEGASLGYWDWDYHTHEHHVNQRWRDILGLGEDFTYDWKALVHPDDKERVKTEITGYIKKGKKYVVEYRMRHTLGHWIWVQGAGAVVSYDKITGVPRRVCGTLQDITERMQTEQNLRRSESRLQLSQRIARMGSWRWQLEDDEVWWSDYMYELFAIPHGTKALTLLELEPFVHPADRDEVSRAMKALREGGVGEFECRVNDAQGVDKYLYSFVIPRRDDDGEFVGVDGILMDISERKRLEERQRLSNTIFECSSEGMMVTDEKVRIVAVNPAFSTISGYSEQEVLGENPSVLSSGEQDKEFYKQLWHALKTQGHWQGEIWNRRKNGTHYPQWLTISAVTDRDGKAVNYIGAFTDISRIKESERRLNYLAHHDPLTDLPNRLLFTTRLEHSLQQMRRRGEGGALLFVDLDNFKQINDSLGHAAGDEVLQVIASRLKGAVRGNDTVARLGGDEFAVVLESASERDAIAEVADKLLALIGGPVKFDNHQLVLGGSIGISIYPTDGESVAELLKNADAAMYQAKENGRNNYRFFNASMTSRVFERLLMENSLRQAIDENQLEVYYQPQLNLDSEEIIGAEALIRWHHPQNGLISPARFIPLAEESGLIVPIGEWVLRQACQQMVIFRQSAIAIKRIAVNLSAVQLIQPSIVQTVSKVLRETGCKGEWIELEVTEGCIMHGAEGVITVLEEFRAMGITLAVDDFGTGYSSLSYLKRLPIDILKVDKSFVDGIPDGEDDVAISKAIVVLGQSLGLTLVAEGIETREQHDFLRALGCEMGQGYLYSPPVPLAQFEKMLERV